MCFVLFNINLYTDWSHVSIISWSTSRCFVLSCEWIKFDWLNMMKCDPDQLVRLLSAVRINNCDLFTGGELRLWVESGRCRPSWLTADIIMWPAAGRSDPNRHTTTVQRNSEVVLIHTQVYTDGDKHDGSVLTVSLDLFCPSLITHAAGPLLTLCRWGWAHEAVRTDQDSRLMWVCELFCQ